MRSPLFLLLFPFLLLSFYIVPYASCFPMFFSLIYICCSFRAAFYLLFFPLKPHVSDLQGSRGALVSFPILSSCVFSSFSSILFLTPSVFLCFFHWSMYAVVSGRHSICCFPPCSHMFLTRREPGVPLSLIRPYPLTFSPPSLLYCSLPFLFFYVFFIDLYLL